MSPDLATLAIKAALINDWQEAIRTNLVILKDDPKDIGALNRLAHAYKESGNLEEARQTYRRVLKIDRFNLIAQKNLKFLEVLPKFSKKQEKACRNNEVVLGSRSFQPKMFLEEPGKTKVVNLVNLAPTDVLLTLSCGTQINPLIKRRTIIFVDTSGVYLGALPDDLSAKLIKRIGGGNRYEALIKTVAKNSLSIFIREVYCAPRFKNQPTFPCAINYSFTKRRSISPPEEPGEEGMCLSEEGLEDLA